LKKISKKKVLSRRENSVAKKGAFGLFFLAFWIFFGWLLFFSPALEISQIEVVGLEGEELGAGTKRALKKQAADFFSDQKGVFFGRNFLFFFPKQLEGQLRDQFKNLKEVRVTKQFPKSVRVEAQNRERFITWCQVKRECFLVDQAGIIFYHLNKAPELEKKSQARVLEQAMSHEGEQFKVGQQFLDPGTVDLILEIALTKNQYDWQLDSIETPSWIAEQVQVKTNAGWKAYFSTKQNPQEQLAVLERVLQDEVGPENLNQLEYVDLRIADRAVFKLKPQTDAD
jgi:cell division septal protein FtsQ